MTMQPEFRLLQLAAVLLIGIAFVGNAVRQRARLGRSSLRWPDRRHPGVVATDVVFWLSVAGWSAGSLAWIGWPANRSLFVPLTDSPVVPVQWLGVATLYLGVAVILWGFVSLGASFRTSIDYEEQTSLVTRGVYRFSRNPMAAGLILVGWGSALIPQTWFALLVATGLTVANRLRVRHEELQLRRLLGASYLRYMSRVPRFVGIAAQSAAQGLMDRPVVLLAGLAPAQVPLSGRSRPHRISVSKPHL
jgi:protein-S-isoprenylcysteine O-methyltransferase Ste14